MPGIERHPRFRVGLVRPRACAATRMWCVCILSPLFSCLRNTGVVGERVPLLSTSLETDGVRLSSQSIPDDVWEEIPCDAGFDTVCGFAAQLEVGPETQRVEHMDPGARLAVVVYSLAFRTGRGFSAGMMQLPIAHRSSPPPSRYPPYFTLSHYLILF